MFFPSHYCRYKTASSQCQSAEATIKHETEQTEFLKRLVDEKYDEVVIQVLHATLNAMI